MLIAHQTHQICGEEMIIYAILLAQEGASSLSIGDIVLGLQQLANVDRM
jgi:hypothetical protein